MLPGAYVKVLLKSLLTALLASSLFFFFLMMATVAVMAARARLTSQPLQAPGVVVMPTEFLRQVGLPLTAVAFTVTFVLARSRFRKSQGH
jgi:hypothetical protein